MASKSLSPFLLLKSIKIVTKAPISQISRKISTFGTSQSPTPFWYSSKAHYSISYTASSQIIKDLLAKVERDRQLEREGRLKAGLDTKDIDAEGEEDYMGVGPLIEKLEKEKLKEISPELLYRREQPTDSESDEDERFAPDVVKERFEQFQKKFKRHKELLKNFTDAETLDDAFKWMNRIDKFEQKHFQLEPEYRVIGELMNRLKVADGKDKFVLQHKLNRALRLVERKEAYDPNDPFNYGVFQDQQQSFNAAILDDEKLKKEKQIIQGGFDDDDDGDVESDDDEFFDDMKERDDIVLEKLNSMDKKLEEKLSELDYTFGKKRRVLEEEIRDLAEERNTLTEKERIPMYRKGFDVRMLSVNRTSKVKKGGRVARFTAIVAVGNYDGVVGFAKGKGKRVAIAAEKAHAKCFQNLHYVERHEEHTIPHAIQATYKKTKVYLWPARTQTGVKAGKKIVHPILVLAGFANIKSKVIGSRNPYNTVKALFKALNAVETPKDVQEKFGRTVVENYLLE